MQTDLAADFVGRLLNRMHVTGVHLLGKQGDRGPWASTQSYQVEKDTIPVQNLKNGTLAF